jgi:hypothetical protein
MVLIWYKSAPSQYDFNVIIITGLGRSGALSPLIIDIRSFQSQKHTGHVR